MDIPKLPPAPPKSRARLEYFHKYRHALSFRAGAAYEMRASKDADPVNPLGGVQFFFADPDFIDLEIGADLFSDGTGVLHGSRRWIASRTRFRPYLKGGLGVRVIPSERLVTFLKLPNYQIRGASGFEMLISEPLSFRSELELVGSTEQLQAALTLGLVYAW